MENKLIVSSSPHVRTNKDTSYIMKQVVIALLPATLAALFFFRLSALNVIFFCVTGSVGAEFLCQKISKQESTIGDFSAVVTGLLLAFNVPASLPWWMCLLGAAFAIIVVKMVFGGIGNNFVNPALAARAFLLASFPVAMTLWTRTGVNWVSSGNIDAYTTATPLSFLKAGSNGVSSLADSGISISNMLIGNIGGCIGETSVVLIILGGLYLMYKGMKPIKAFKIMEFVRKGKASKDPATWAEHRKTMEEAGIEEWYIDSCQKIKYMFPKAHAAAYVTSAFRIAWYKVHMPAYFYASWFSTKATDFDIESMINGYDAIKNKILEIKNKGYDATNKENGVLECLNVALEMSARNIKVAPFDLYKSKGLTFNVQDDNTIIPPFITIDGLGETVAKNIESEAKKHPFISIEDFQTRCKVSQTLIDKMRAMGIFNSMPESSQLSLFDF